MAALLPERAAEQTPGFLVRLWSEHYQIACQESAVSRIERGRGGGGVEGGIGEGVGG